MRRRETNIEDTLPRGGSADPTEASQVHPQGETDLNKLLKKRKKTWRFAKKDQSVGGWVNAAVLPACGDG